VRWERKVRGRWGGRECSRKEERVREREECLLNMEVNNKLRGFISKITN